MSGCALFGCDKPCEPKRATCRLHHDLYKAAPTAKGRQIGVGNLPKVTGYSANYASRVDVCRDFECMQKIEKGEVMLNKLTQEMKGGKPGLKDVWPFHQKCLFKHIARSRSDNKPLKKGRDIENIKSLDKKDICKVVALVVEETKTRKRLQEAAKEAIYLEQEDKFWSISAVGDKTITCYGPKGEPGFSIEKKHPSAVAAKTWCEKKAAEKRSKGYESAEAEGADSDSEVDEDIDLEVSIIQGQAQPPPSLPKTKIKSTKPAKAAVSASTTSATKRKPVPSKKKGTDEESSADDDDDDPGPKKKKPAVKPAAAKATTTAKTKPKPKCPYGAACYRKNPQHLQEFDH